MSDRQFYGILGLVACVLTTSAAGCNIAVNHQDNLAMVTMVNGGADPIDARCAVEGDSGNNVCVVRAATKSTPSVNHP